MIKEKHVERINIESGDRCDGLREVLHKPEYRLGLITSIDGAQLITLVLDVNAGRSTIWETPLSTDVYSSLTPHIPQCHWFERSTWDMFGLKPTGHPRLKHNLLHEPYDSSLFPLKTSEEVQTHETERFYKCLEVDGQGVYEVPVGPIHAGIIEPAHFRFSCLGEVILNLEIRLGYVHRGIEKRMVETPVSKMRFVAESIAGDMIAANGLAHAIAIESCMNLDVAQSDRVLRNVSLEIERVAMHVNDLSGIAGDIGFSAVASSMAIVRGDVLGCAELLAGTRFQKGFVKPGGVSRRPSAQALGLLRQKLKTIQPKLEPLFEFIFSNQVAQDRMRNVGVLTPKLAADFGVIGPAGRASGIAYDARQCFARDDYPQLRVPVETAGDVYSRAKIRVLEIRNSLQLMDEQLDTYSPPAVADENLDKNRSVASSIGGIRSGSIGGSRSAGFQLPPNSVGIGVVESHRGELIHLLFTDAQGKASRYAIKDPSVNNWTALAIAVRNCLLSDFPLCNKSFALSYSGHDL